MEFRAEDDCLFVGGPFDGAKLPIPLQAEEWAFPNYAASLTASWQDALPGLHEELAEKDPDSISPHEEAELDERVIRALEDAHEQYAKPAPGGVLYRRVPGENRFEFARNLTPEEHRAWKGDNIKVPKPGSR